MSWKCWYMTGGHVMGVLVHDRWVCRRRIIVKVNEKSD